jgi:Rubisco LSMT substrate-binding
MWLAVSLTGEIFILFVTSSGCDPWLQASLVAADRLWQSKRDILESVGFDTPQEFPISADGMPQQLLSYLRLARLQNSAEFAKVRSELQGWKFEASVGSSLCRVHHAAVGLGVCGIASASSDDAFPLAGQLRRRHHHQPF